MLPPSSSSIRDSMGDKRDSARSWRQSPSVINDEWECVSESSSVEVSDETIVMDDGESRSVKEELAARETRALLRLRFFVILVLLCAAIGVSLTFFFVSRDEEMSTFKAEFRARAKKLEQAFADKIVEQNIKALVLLSSSITSNALATNSTWPFVTVSNFRQRAEDVIDLTGVMSVSFHPVLTDDTVDQWGEYSIENRDWFSESLEHQLKKGIDSLLPASLQRRDRPSYEISDRDLDLSFGIPNRVFLVNRKFDMLVDPGPGPYAPVWQIAPVPSSTIVNYNFLRHPEFGVGMRACLSTKEIVIGGFDVAPPGGVNSEHGETQFFAYMMSNKKKELVDYEGDPFSGLYVPVFDSFDERTREIVGLLSANFKWADYFENSVKENGEMAVVIVNSCEGAVTYLVNGPNVEFLGFGDYHESEYSHIEEEISFEALVHNDDSRIAAGEAWCTYSFRVYPTKAFEEAMMTNKSIVTSSVAASIFVFAIVLFVIYNKLVDFRQNLVTRTAERSRAIVSSLFPNHIHERLIEDGSALNDFSITRGFSSEKNRIRTFLTENGGEKDGELDVKPIADLFPHTTICFTDIAGFTSWSSSREPAHVFILLQTAYQAFDNIAKRYKVFKVETIGDSYMAVTGLPNPQERHAVLMARFAWDCMQKFSRLAKKLEPILGPDTSDLGIRIGLHSGPVTAGVLRGDRARFQLFGDTVNTAARMESTGETNRIQASQATAALLEAANKGHWLTQRSSSVVAKGKGVLETYWVVLQSPVHKPTQRSSGSTISSLDPSPVVDRRLTGGKKERLIDWMANMIIDHLKNIVAHRQKTGDTVVDNSKDLVYFMFPGKACLEEVEECIHLPKFNNSLGRYDEQHKVKVKIDEEVCMQVRLYVQKISALYRKNPFHNFEHAAHVTMSVDKFLKRIVKPDIEIESHDAVASHLHDYTHGIISDPTTILAIVISAMVHDSDHRGVSNIQLAKEEGEMAEHYKNKSLAEQNSLDLSWNLLMEDQFSEFRVCMFGNRTNMMRFRQVLVNVVLATDIFDKELNDLRKGRWMKAFDADHVCDNFNDLRATIVLEHIIQASDVSHTMQHWHVYRRWNQRLFTEMYVAYKAGRMEKNPVSFWYKGELGFFDNYIIPLAKKLKECNVFGVSSYECLSYAMQNRAEWEVRGEQIVADLYHSLCSDDETEDETASSYH